MPVLLVHVYDASGQRMHLTQGLKLIPVKKSAQFFFFDYSQGLVLKEILTKTIRPSFPPFASREISNWSKEKVYAFDGILTFLA